MLVFYSKIKMGHPILYLTISTHLDVSYNKITYQSLQIVQFFYHVHIFTYFLSLCKEDYTAIQTNVTLNMHAQNLIKYR